MLVATCRLQIQLTPLEVTASERLPQSGRLKAPAGGDKLAPANAAIFTGVYILCVGLALMLAPQTIFGLLFDIRWVVCSICWTAASHLEWFTQHELVLCAGP